MSRYAEAHANPQGPGDACPTALQIVKDAEMEGKLVGKSAVITGVSTGIGLETVRAIAATGAFLYLTARDLTKAKTALGDIFKPEQMELVHMDQFSLESMRNAAKTILSKTDKVILLINNAGIMSLQFATNHLSHFMLFSLLKHAMLAATTPEFQSRVVNVSSDSHRHGGINASDNYSFQKGGYDPWKAYSQSKTAGIYMANELDRRYGSRGLRAYSVHPGMIATNLGQYLSTEQIEHLEQGAATTVWAAVGRELEGKGGIFLAGCAEAVQDPEGTEDYVGTFVNHTYKPEDETRLWKDSLEMVGLADDE
ncbi:hypothetical protein BDV40DRAFT_313660 [Aspergillus tamarii]|uniref:Short-chain dehydrogenase n=1 Tax=Aspergillus tamarii TaxID=41984 RepID=A0A5N6V7V9_ASPTM|nr:hypothetical protein BDV40DRAFT_313660 [Aspergillus tamarii]